MTVEASALRRVVAAVALLNLAYFGIEFAIALAIGSVSLLADSADFFEDAAVNFLILAALGWSASRRAKVGMLLSLILLAPVFAFLWTLWEKISVPFPPAAVPLGATGLGALAINLFSAFLLARYRHHAGSLTKAAFFFGAQRCARQRRDHRGQPRHVVASVCLAGRDRRPRHRLHEPRCGARSLDRRTGPASPVRRRAVTGLEEKTST